MMILPVTTTFIALYAIALNVMTGWVGLYRGKIGVLRGDGGDAVLFKRMRIHGNLTENAPALALALGASEILGIAQWALWLAVISFILGRILHFKYFDDEKRGIAMVLTQLPAAILAIWAVYAVLTA